MMSHHPPSDFSDRRPQLVELTDKKWKLLQAKGMIITGLSFSCLIGWCIIHGTAATHEELVSGPSTLAVAFLWVDLLVLAVGVGFYIYGRLGAWWHHG